MWSGVDLRGRSPLVSFNHVIAPHFVTFSSSLYTTFRNSNPNRNPTVITDLQIDPRDPQIVTVRSAQLRILSCATIKCPYPLLLQFLRSEEKSEILQMT